MVRRLLIIALIVYPASGQLAVQKAVLNQDASGLHIQMRVSHTQNGILSPDAIFAGERLRMRPNGTIVAVRSLAVRIPDRNISAAADQHDIRSISVPMRNGFLDRIGGLEATTEDAVRVLDLAQAGNSYAASVEVAIAEYDPSSEMLTLPGSIDVRIVHSSTRSDRSMISATSSPMRISSASGAKRTSSRFSVGEWYKFEIDQTGIFKLTRSWFRNAGVTATDLQTIARLRIFGNGGRPVPESLIDPRPEGLVELARRIIDADGDGELDDEDGVLLYGRSVRDWTYDSGQRQYAHTVNPYDEKNAYFFTFDADTLGRDMPVVQSASSAPVEVQHVLGRIAVDEDKVNFVRSGRNWVGTAFDAISSSSVFVNTLPGVLPGLPVQYRAQFYSRSASIDTFRVAEQDVQIGNPVLMFTSDVSSVDQVFNYAYRSPVSNFMYSGSFPEGRSVLRITFGARTQAAKGWLDWFEIFYRRSLTVSEDRLLFPSPDTSATLSYTVRNLSSRDTRVFDVTDHGNVAEVGGVEFDPVDPSICTFRLSHTQGSPAELAVIGASGYLTPPEPRKVEPTDLRGYALPVHFIIISPSEFIEQAERLEQHRESGDGIQTLVVNIEDIYDEFGGGLLDPFAVRDFLAYAREQYAGPLRYVLFFGNGHFDYRNISTSVRNWVPPYETAESNFQILSYTSDDYFVQLDQGNPRISLAIGRLPARSQSDIEAMVDKIIQYEESPLDSWRNRITFIADDGQTSTNPFEGSLHTSQAENLATLHTPNTFEKRKIYIVEYPTVISASGRRKPAANRDIVSAFNEGSLIINFTGHGNPRLWTHEAIFTREAELPQLTNNTQLPMLVAATCNYAQWDDPNEQSSGEMLMTSPAGGTIAVVTATRSVYSFDNAELNYVLYDNLFTNDSAGNPVRLGDAFWAMKQVRYSTNDQKYHLLGDPTLRLLRPVGSVTIDTINSISTSDSVVSVPTLGVLSVAGQVRNPDSTVASGFSGTGLLELFDSKRIVTVPEWGNYSYERTGSVLYRGEISVSAGRYAARVPVPKDVTFGSRARLSLYAIGATTDAVGTTEQLIIAGTDTAAAIDTTGPQITIRLQSQDFRSGDVVPPDPTLIVELSDVNGINTSTIGIGHQLEAVLSSDQRIINLSDDYKGNLDTYQSGRAVRTLSDLPEGRQSVRVRAWDTHNNSSTAEVDFEVRSGGGADVFHVVNYPNPFSSSTAFTMQRASAVPVDVKVRIYTVAGRMIEELEEWSLTDTFIRIPWDGRDREGNELANGVYLYKVILKSVNGGETREVVEKLVVMR